MARRSVGTAHWFPPLLSPARELVAQIAAPNPGTFPLTVTNPNPGSASALPLSLKVGPGLVVLTLEPNSGTDVRVSNTLNLGLMVNGTDNPAVTLQVNGIAGGNGVVGTAVSNADGSITYTAPPVVPTPSNIVQLTITSVDNPAVSITQNISVMNPIPILTSATPMAFNPGPATIVLTGQKFITGAQVLVNGSPVSTTFNSGTQLTANVDQAQPGNLDLQVLNPNPGPAASTDLIATVSGTPPTPIVPPNDAARFLEQATFGPTDADIRTLSLDGYPAWLNQQFAIQPTPTEPAVEQALIVNNPPCATSDVKCNAALFVQNNQDEGLVQDTFWQQSLTAPDELRQRVKYALSQMFVISSNNTTSIQNMPRGEASYYDMLGNDAFGNFRQLLAGCHPQSDDGPVPLHAGQRQGQRHHRSRRKLRARSHAALHHRPVAVERRWLAASSTATAIPSPPIRIPTSRVWPPSSPASVGTSPATRPTTRGPTAASTSAPATAKSCCPCRASPATTPRSKRISSASPFRHQAAPIPTAISRSLSTRSSIIPICRRFSPSR